jgi:xylulokinase
MQSCAFAVRSPPARRARGRRWLTLTVRLFLPYLAGERTPTLARGRSRRLRGLSRGHDADDLLRAVLEGVAMAMRDILVRAIAGSRTTMREVRVAGGGARSNAWCQIKADVMQLPFVRTSTARPAPIGAAMAAAVGLGWHRNLAAAASPCAPSNASSSRGRRLPTSTRSAANASPRATTRDRAGECVHARDADAREATTRTPTVR